MPEAAEGALPQGPGPAIPPEISAQGAAAGQAAAEAQPDAASQPVQVSTVCCMLRVSMFLRKTQMHRNVQGSGMLPIGADGSHSLVTVQTGVSRHADGEGTAPGPRKLRVPRAGSDAAAPPSPVGVADGPLASGEESPCDSGESCDGDDAGDGGRDANLTISTGVRGGLKMHDSSGEGDSPSLSRQNRCAWGATRQGLTCPASVGVGTFWSMAAPGITMSYLYLLQTFQMLPDLLRVSVPYRQPEICMGPPNPEALPAHVPDQRSACRAARRRWTRRGPRSCRCWRA